MENLQGDKCDITKNHSRGAEIPSIYRPHSPAKAEEEGVRGLTSWTGSSCTWHTQTQLVNPANCQRDGLQKCNPGHFPENMPANPIFIL